MASRSLSVLIITALAATAAFAETPAAEAPAPTTQKAARGWTHFDVGLSAGVNSPAGIVGAEVEFRPLQFLGIHFAGGYGAWGPRLSPALRVYPIGLWAFGGPFLEGAVAMNLGGPFEVNVGDQSFSVQRRFSPAVIPSLGGKLKLGPVFLEARVGWAFRLNRDNFTVTNGDANDPLIGGAINAAQHEGLAGSAMFGINFL